MEVSTAIITLCVGIMGIYIIKIRRKMLYFKNRGIPHIPPWPILGNIAAAVFRKKHFFYITQDIYNIDKEAKYVGAFDFSRIAFVIRDPDLIRTVAVKEFDHFPDHRVLFSDSNDPLFSKNLLSLRGEKWKEMRNLLTPAFTSSKMKTMFGLIETCAVNFSEYMATQSDQNRTNNLDMKDAFARYTNDVIATCAFGITVDSMKDPKNEFYVQGRLATKFEGFVRFKILLALAIPSLTSMFGIKILPESVINYFTSTVKNIVEARDSKGIRRPDMIQLMLDARDSTNKINLTPEDMTAQAFIFFLGGFDTTSTTMSFVAHELAQHPEVQQKLQDEIDGVLEATDNNPTYEVINSMPYLDAVFNEVLRLHPQLPMIDRVCVKSFELPPALPGLKPTTVEPGTTIWIPAAGIHYDPKYYEDPEKFDPDRFLLKKASTNPSTYLSFGIGPRMCIGNRFALLETKILFFHLLAKCDFKPCEKTINSLILDPTNLGITIKGGFWLDVKRRDTSAT